MTSDSAHRGVRLERIANSRYVATNDRGGQISMGTGEGTDFTPVDLLLAAIGGCTAVDVDILTSRRAEPDSFEVLVDEEFDDGAGRDDRCRQRIGDVYRGQRAVASLL